MITRISAPIASNLPFHVDKRYTFTIGFGAAYSEVCLAVEGVELSLEALPHNTHPKMNEYIAVEKRKHFLAGGGIAIAKLLGAPSTTNH